MRFKNTQACAFHQLFIIKNASKNTIINNQYIMGCYFKLIHIKKKTPLELHFHKIKLSQAIFTSNSRYFVIICLNPTTVKCLQLSLHLNAFLCAAQQAFFSQPRPGLCLQWTWAQLSQAELEHSLVGGRHYFHYSRFPSLLHLLRQLPVRFRSGFY